MSDVELQPDPIVRTALQRLPIPPHSDGFWDRLDRALDAEGGAVVAARPDERTVLVAAPGDGSPPAATSTAPEEAAVGADPALALVPRSMRRTSNGVLVAVAAATVLVVALASTSLLEERSGTKGGGSSTAQASVALDALVSESQPASATPDTMSSAGESTSSDAVLSWVDDIGTGDGDAAWKAMGPASKAHFGSQDAFEAQMTVLADDYGAWSSAQPEELLVTPVRTSDEGTLAVVTLADTGDQASGAEPGAAVVPVRLVDGDVVLEPFATAGELEVVVPEPAPADGPRPSVGSEEELVIVVPSDAEAPVLRLDDGEAVVCGEADGTELTDLEGSSGQRCAYLPPEGIAPGGHRLTTAFVGSDGESISAESVLFDAA